MTSTDTARALLAEHHDDLDAALAHVDPRHRVTMDREIVRVDPATGKAEVWNLTYVVTVTDDSGATSEVRARTGAISAHEDAATARERARETEVELLARLVDLR